MIILIYHFMFHIKQFVLDFLILQKFGCYVMLLHSRVVIRVKN